MNRDAPGPGGPPDEERLSGTLSSGLRNVAGALGGLSTTLALVGVVSLVLGLVLLIFLADLRLYSYIALGAGGASLAVSVAISFQVVSEAVTGRRGRYSTNTVIMVTACIGLAAVANFLAFENPKRMDVTATKQFELAPRTLELLKNLKEPVEAKAFFIPGRNPQDEAVLGLLRNQADDMLHEFEVRSGKFSYEFIDPERDPLIGREYGFSRNATIVFESMESKKRHQIAVSRLLEQDAVTGLLIVTGQEQKRVHFLTGHGERPIQDAEPNTDGFGIALAGITAENYAVSSINISLASGKETLQREREEKRVNMLVVGGPKNDLLEGEAEILDDYLKNGGNMLVLLEPDTPKSFRDFFARWGIVVGEGHIVDESRSVGSRNEITVVDRDQYFEFIPEEIQSFLINRVHPSLGSLGKRQITGGLDVTYYPGLTSLSPVEEGVFFFPQKLREEEEEEEDPAELPMIFGTALARTSSNSWLIKDPTRSEPQEGDLRDIFIPAVAIKAFAPLDEEPPTDLSGVNPASIIIFGDSDFASNRYFYTSSNSDFFLNSINWLVGDLALADIRPKPFAFRELVLTPNQFDFMRYSSWFLIPGLMAVLGGIVWWRRR